MSKLTISKLPNERALVYDIILQKEILSVSTSTVVKKPVSLGKINVNIINGMLTYSNINVNMINQIDFYISNYFVEKGLSFYDTLIKTITDWLVLEGITDVSTGGSILMPNVVSGNYGTVKESANIMLADKVRININKRVVNKEYHGINITINSRSLSTEVEEKPEDRKGKYKKRSKKGIKVFIPILNGCIDFLDVRHLNRDTTIAYINVFNTYGPKAIMMTLLHLFKLGDISYNIFTGNTIKLMSTDIHNDPAFTVPTNLMIDNINDDIINMLNKMEEEAYDKYEPLRVTCSKFDKWYKKL